MLVVSFSCIEKYNTKQYQIAPVKATSTHEAFDKCTENCTIWFYTKFYEIHGHGYTKQYFTTPEISECKNINNETVECMCSC